MTKSVRDRDELASFSRRTYQHANTCLLTDACPWQPRPRREGGLSSDAQARVVRGWKRSLTSVAPSGAAWNKLSPDRAGLSQGRAHGGYREQL
jgi:hypothetical protein